ncbi:MAG: polysaccharide biosynthesis/export family protein, partial [Pseudomonadota bacterium]
MTDSRLRPAHRALLALGAAFATFAPFCAGAADEPANPNTFNTPAYPAATQRGAAQTGQQPGQANQPGAQGTQQGLRPNAIPNNGLGNINPRTGANPPDALSRRAEQPPPKPGEFQKFVETATGRLLPLFGSSFFGDASDTYSPVDNVPVSADYTVGPGDEIILRAWGAIDVDYRSTVDRNGLLNLPKVGSFNVSGVKASELEKHLRAQIGRLYTNFDLSVSLGQLRGVKV